MDGMEWVNIRNVFLLVMGLVRRVEINKFRVLK